MHGDHGIGEALVVPGLARAFLAFDRIGVDVVAGIAVFGGDQIGADALGRVIGIDRKGRIDRPGAAGGADADPAHGFDTAADRHVVLLGHDMHGGEVDRIETGRAEPVDLDAGDGLVIARVDDGGAGDVAAGLADRVDAAHHHVVDLGGVQFVAVAHRFERLGREFQRGHFVHAPSDLPRPLGVRTWS